MACQLVGVKYCGITRLLVLLGRASVLEMKLDVYLHWVPNLIKFELSFDSFNSSVPRDQQRTLLNICLRLTRYIHEYPPACQSTCFLHPFEDRWTPTFSLQLTFPPHGATRHCYCITDAFENTIPWGVHAAQNATNIFKYIRMDIGLKTIWICMHFTQILTASLMKAWSWPRTTAQSYRRSGSEFGSWSSSRTTLRNQDKEYLYRSHRIEMVSQGHSYVWTWHSRFVRTRSIGVNEERLEI